jgi:ferredoxin-type protein NapH
MVGKRRVVQTIIFLGMFFIPVLNALEIYFIKGTFISMDIGGMGIADPVMIFQAVFAAANYSGVLVASTAIPLLLTFFLGRVWCSWACPYTFMAEMLEKIPFILKKMRKNHAKISAEYIRKRTTALRYAVFIFLIAIVGISGVPILHLISPPSVISTQALLLVKSAITAEILLIAVLLSVEIFFSYRFACRILCPTGTCLSLFKNKHSLYVHYEGSCAQCGRCLRNCPMGLDPRKDGADRLCHNCGKCIDNCPDSSLKWGLD